MEENEGEFGFVTSPDELARIFQEPGEASEDVVTYRIFHRCCIENTEDSLTKLRTLGEQIQHFVKSELHKNDHIWQRDGFRLDCKVDTASGIPHLFGESNFGENLDDEWLILWLIYQISNDNPDVACQVWDNDGEILLIEAASVLPEWAEPDCTQNRVYVYQNRLHLLGPAHVSIVPGCSVKLQNALEFIFTCHARPGVVIPTEAPGRVQELIFRQIMRFPKQLQTNRQKARCFLPRKIAKLLYLDRQMIAPAVEAFYERDPHSMKAASFLTNAKEMGDFVETSVQFTRCLYAMVAQQDFHPPRGWTAPFNKSNRSNSLGLKLTYGFEILLTGGGRRFNRDTEVTSLEEWMAELEAAGIWNRDDESLENNEGLMETAKALFKDLQRNEDRGWAAYTKLKMLLSSIVEDSAVEAKDDDVDDSEDWLSSAARESVISEELDKRRKEIERGMIPGSEDQNDPILNPGMVYDKISTFINSESSLEGVEVSSEISERSFNFDVNKFMSSLRNMLSGDSQEGQPSIEESLDDGSESSDEDDEQVEFTQAYDECLSEELKGSHVGESFQFSRPEIEGGDNADQLDDAVNTASGIDEVENLAQNFKFSHASENGQPGPASSLMGALNIAFRDENTAKDNSD